MSQIVRVIEFGEKEVLNKLFSWEIGLSALSRLTPTNLLGNVILAKCARVKNK